MAKIPMEADPIADQLRKQYPGRSIMPKKEPENKTQKMDPKDVEVVKVTSGKVTFGKERLREKFKRTFIQADAKDVVTYAVTQLIIPSAKNIALAALAMAFFGKPGNHPWYGSNTTTMWPSQTGYTTYSYRGQTNVVPWTTPQNNPPMVNNQARATHNFGSITLQQYSDAEDVISSMLDYLDRTGEISVAIFYQLLGVPPANITNVDELWGWRSFTKLEPRPVRGGYTIDISPAPMQLR